MLLVIVGLAACFARLRLQADRRSKVADIKGIVCLLRTLESANAFFPVPVALRQHGIRQAGFGFALGNKGFHTFPQRCDDIGPLFGEIVVLVPGLRQDCKARSPA